MNWVLLKNFSIESQLKAEGLSFDAFDIVEKTFKDSGLRKLRQKVIGRLGSELRIKYDKESKDEKDLNSIVNGCYCIGLGGQYKIPYSEDFSSRVIYIGSGRVYNRIKSHLTAKLFDFAQAMPGIPLQFHICDLDQPKLDRKDFEQGLLQKFVEDSGGSKPLLNANDAKSDPLKLTLPSGWDKPLHKDKGVQIAKWLIRPTNMDEWKGALDP
ncbi:MAG: hypothetical protein WBO29_10845 [Albidovulum sp.]